MVFAAELGAAAGGCPAPRPTGTARWSPRWACTTYAGDLDRLRPAMAVDKKARGRSLRFVVLDGLGAPGILTDPDDAWVRQAWSAVEATP